MLYDYSHYTYDYTVNYKTLQVAIMFSSGGEVASRLKNNYKNVRAETVNHPVCR